MSGGHFEYQQYRINDIADTLRVDIAKTRKKHEYHCYSDSFLAEMIAAHNKARELSVMIQRIDWVLSGDDGEEDYTDRLAEDMAVIEYDNPVNDEKWIQQAGDDE